MGSRPRLYGAIDWHAFLYILIQRSHEEDKKSEFQILPVGGFATLFRSHRLRNRSSEINSEGISWRKLNSKPLDLMDQFFCYAYAIQKLVTAQGTVLRGYNSGIFQLKASKRQHCEINPRSVSQVLLRSPYKEPLMSGRTEINNSSSLPSSLSRTADMAGSKPQSMFVVWHNLVLDIGQDLGWRVRTT
ncbi:unnamed protein product [Vicia faba]|uniref:Uncharacterized protein n=1 Tax=Vicia faba TaxID=3906 RepID=A0AAV1AUG9_VICFA|nr:unnamed protein product [Vicia faba]